MSLFFETGKFVKVDLQLGTLFNKKIRQRADSNISCITGYSFAMAASYFLPTASQLMTLKNAVI